MAPSLGGGLALLQPAERRAQQLLSHLPMQLRYLWSSPGATTRCGRGPSPQRWADLRESARAARRARRLRPLARHRVRHPRGQEGAGVAPRGRQRLPLRRRVDRSARAAAAELDAHLATHPTGLEARVDDDGAQADERREREPRGPLHGFARERRGARPWRPAARASDIGARASPSGPGNRAARDTPGSARAGRGRSAPCSRARPRSPGRAHCVRSPSTRCPWARRRRA